MQLFLEIGLLSATFLVVGNIIGIEPFTTADLVAAEIGNSPLAAGCLNPGRLPGSHWSRLLLPY